MEVVKRSHDPSHVVPAHSQKGTNEWRPSESMVSVSRIILLQSSRPRRAAKASWIPPTSGRRGSRKSELARACGKRRIWNDQPLKGHLISKKKGIAEAMP